MSKVILKDPLVSMTTVSAQGPGLTFMNSSLAPYSVCLCVSVHKLCLHTHAGTHLSLYWKTSAEVQISPDLSRRLLL